MSSVPPVLFSVTALKLLTPVPTVLRIVPALVTASDVPPSPTMPLSLWMWNSAPVWLSSTVIALVVFSTPVPVKFTVP